MWIGKTANNKKIEGLKREVQRLNDRLAMAEEKNKLYEELIAVLRDCLGAVQCEKQLSTVINKADLNTALKITRPTT